MLKHLLRSLSSNRVLHLKSSGRSFSYRNIYIKNFSNLSHQHQAKMPDRYAEAHSSLQGPGDARPTALQIIKDEGLEGNMEDKVPCIQQPHTSSH
jgi:hypothetical protein